MSGQICTIVEINQMIIKHELVSEILNIPEIGETSVITDENGNTYTKGILDIWRGIQIRLNDGWRKDISEFENLCFEIRVVCTDQAYDPKFSISRWPGDSNNVSKVLTISNYTPNGIIDLYSSEFITVKIPINDLKTEIYTLNSVEFINFSKAVSNYTNTQIHVRNIFVEKTVATEYVGPLINVSPIELNFGVVQEKKYTQLNLHIQNTGDLPLEVYNIDKPEYIDINMNSFVLEPNGDIELTLKYFDTVTPEEPPVDPPTGPTEEEINLLIDKLFLDLNSILNLTESNLNSKEYFKTKFYDFLLKTKDKS